MDCSTLPYILLGADPLLSCDIINVVSFHQLLPTVWHTHWPWTAGWLWRTEEQSRSVMASLYIFYSCFFSWFTADVKPVGSFVLNSIQMRAEWSPANKKKTQSERQALESCKQPAQPVLMQRFLWVGWRDSLTNEVFAWLKSHKDLKDTWL